MPSVVKKLKEYRFEVNTELFDEHFTNIFIVKYSIQKKIPVISELILVEDDEKFPVPIEMLGSDAKKIIIDRLT